MLLDRLSNQGRAWYRKAELEDVDPFRSRDIPKFKLFEGNEIHQIGLKPTGTFPKRRILLTPKQSKEKAAVVGYWLRWDFTKSPHEFRLFLGHWYKVNGKPNFNGFRFEAPETGNVHDFYHCQPCRNFGDERRLDEAAFLSERFPAIPLNASNIVELTVCGLMATLGREETKKFLRKLMRTDGWANKSLLTAYRRCAKESSVNFVNQA